MVFVYGDSTYDFNITCGVIAPESHPGESTKPCFLIFANITGLHQRIALYMASLPYEGLFRWRGRFRLKRVDPLEEGRSTMEGVAQSVYVDTASCSAVGRLPCGEPGGA
ncbi:hypothetical protein M9H77_17479 [Catharanthus roseus]|uniref:Uncharacterized protein n=1 Tax=Catharanthus roseus TaxID=4058 RepID=A0ACC0B4R9_CATRO|nr:hypothetical protein M9H77_17479 [Catharanthus roseus]